MTFYETFLIGVYVMVGFGILLRSIKYTDIPLFVRLLAPVIWPMFIGWFIAGLSDPRGE